jgi:hypothetical protein
MHARTWTVVAIASMLPLVATLAADDPKPADPVSFDRDARPILRKRCANCHNAERPRGELDLTSYAGVLAGGASGKAAVPGNPDDSPLYTLPAHLEDPHMPPNAPKIPLREIDVLRRWIEGGLIETPGEKTADSRAKAGGPARAEARPEPAGGLVSPEVMPRGAAVTALAVSPTGRIAAVSGHRQVHLFDPQARKLLGAVAFPEGDVFALKFSRDGQMLLAAGGVGAESGKAVLFLTETWARASSVGDELDAILAADLSPDASHVVLGGPNRVVKVVANPGGQTVHTFRKPTDWVTAASFSPDGLLVAAGDRFGGLFVWEVRSGREFLTLRGHPLAINAIGWDAKGDGLVTAGEDGVIQVWNLHSGKISSRWEAHSGGVLAVDVHASGRIASAGRDRRVKVWDQDGRLLADLGPTADQATRVGWTSDGRSIVSGDCAGEVRFWSLADSTSTLLPMPIATRPAPLALVVPHLAPARPYSPRPAATAPAIADRAGSPGAPVDDLEASLASAREAAAAERTVANLSRLVQARARSSGRGHAGTPAPAINSDAVNAARAALASLRAALVADPGNSALTRAAEETERALKGLEKDRDRPTSARVSAASER